MTGNSALSSPPDAGDAGDAGARAQRLRTTLAAFEQGNSPKAWYRLAPLSGEPRASLEHELVLGVTACEDEPLLHDGGAVVQVQRGDVLLQRRELPQDVVILPVQQARERLSRSFSDGTHICRLSADDADQASALGRANAQMARRIEQLASASTWELLLHRRRHRTRSRQVDEWNEQIRAHVADLMAWRARLKP